MRRRWYLTVAVVLAVAAGTPACSTGHRALGTHAARMVIDGEQVGFEPPVRCEQIRWVWFIDTLPQTPGFSAQIKTGSTVEAQLVRIDGLGGFTGTAWDGGRGTEVDATLVDGTFTITGTALGFHHTDPAETATADFEIRTDC
jgi:hypothetical protein